MSATVYFRGVAPGVTRAVTAWIVLVGCGSADPAPPSVAVSAPVASVAPAPTPSPDPSLTEACAMVARTSCARFHACAAPAFDVNYADEPSCVRHRTARCQADSGAATGATAAVLAACNEVLASADCLTFLTTNTPDVCRPPGRLGDGAPCARDSECAGRGCRRTATDDTCGTCTTLPGASEPCPLGACQRTLRCGRDEICHAYGDVGAACEERVECRVGLGCVAGQCAPDLPLGAACSSATAGCSHGDALVCGRDGHCERTPDVVAAGAPPRRDLLRAGCRAARVSAARRRGRRMQRARRAVL